MKIKSTMEVKVDLKDILTELQNLAPSQKVLIAKQLSNWCGSIDMSYIELALKELSKIELKRIKKDRALYNRNRHYFQSVRTLSKSKFAE